MVELFPMTPAEFEAYREYALDDYTRAGRQGTWPSAKVAQEQFEKLLPEGLKTTNQHLLSIKTGDSSSLVGFIWLTVIHRHTGPEAFILDFVIFPESRRQGYGTEALLRAERYALNLGVESLSLNVFSHNQAAQALYEKMGFRPTNIRMSKRIG